MACPCARELHSDSCSLQWKVRGHSQPTSPEKFSWFLSWGPVTTSTTVPGLSEVPVPGSE